MHCLVHAVYSVFLHIIGDLVAFYIPKVKEKKCYCKLLDLWSALLERNLVLGMSIGSWDCNYGDSIMIWIQLELITERLTLNICFTWKKYSLTMSRLCTPSQTFSPPDAKLYNIMWQIYTTLCNLRRYIAQFSPPYRRERPFLRR